MAKGKMRIGYAVMTEKGALVPDTDGSGYFIFRRRGDATAARIRIGVRGLQVVRVTIDTDD